MYNSCIVNIIVFKMSVVFCKECGQDCNCRENGECSCEDCKCKDSENKEENEV
jgi:hypothetical protein